MSTNALSPVVKIKKKRPKTRTSKPKKEIDVIFNEDCKSGLCKVKDEFVSLIITDPPFAIDFQKVGSQYNQKSENVLKGYNKIR